MRAFNIILNTMEKEAETDDGSVDGLFWAALQQTTCYLLSSFKFLGKEGTKQSLSSTEILGHTP